MGRCPGRTLTTDDLDGPHGNSILEQIAAFVAQWRNLVPTSADTTKPARIGHLRFCEPNESADVPQWKGPFANGPCLTLGGLILTHQYDLAPLMTSLSYYIYRLRDQYCHLVETPGLTLLANQIANPVSRLLAVLPELPLFQTVRSGSDPKDNGDVVFSHMDLAPRNILVSASAEGQGLTVTGMLDFEFSAFLPPEQEFLNSIVHQPDDWPADHFRTLISCLARIGVRVPPVDGLSFDTGENGRLTFAEADFRSLKLLEKITGNFAPWWLTSHWLATHSKDDIRREIEKAAVEVLTAINSMFLPGSPS